METLTNQLDLSRFNRRHLHEFFENAHEMEMLSNTMLAPNAYKLCRQSILMLITFHIDKEREPLTFNPSLFEATCKNLISIVSEYIPLLKSNLRTSVTSEATLLLDYLCDLTGSQGATKGLTRS